MIALGPKMELDTKAQKRPHSFENFTIDNLKNKSEIVGFPGRGKIWPELPPPGVACWRQGFGLRFLSGAGGGRQ